MYIYILYYIYIYIDRKIDISHDIIYYTTDSIFTISLHFCKEKRMSGLQMPLLQVVS